MSNRIFCDLGLVIGIGLTITIPAAVRADDCMGRYSNPATAVIDSLGNASPVCVTYLGIVMFQTHDGKYFTATFSKDGSPFGPGHLVHTPDLFAIDPTVSGSNSKTFHYFSCYFPSDVVAAKCKDPKIIVGPMTSLNFYPTPITLQKGASQVVKITANVAVTNLVISLPNSDFKVTTNTCTGTLAKGASCMVTVMAVTPGTAQLDAAFDVAGVQKHEQVPLQSR